MRMHTQISATKKSIFFSFARFKSLFETGAFESMVAFYTQLLRENVDRMEVVGLNARDHWARFMSATTVLRQYYYEQGDSGQVRKTERFLEKVRRATWVLLALTPHHCKKMRTIPGALLACLSATGGVSVGRAAEDLSHEGRGRETYVFSAT